MSVATLSRSPSEVASRHTVASGAEGYRLFGTRVSEHHLLRHGMGVTQFLGLWSAGIHDRSLALKELQTKVPRYRYSHNHDLATNAYWIVCLPTPSRGLPAGNLIVRAREIPLYSHWQAINGPPAVWDAVMAARKELPGYSLWYLEPAWRKTRNGDVLLRPREICECERRQRMRYREFCRWHTAATMLAMAMFPFVIVLHAIFDDPIIVAMRDADGENEQSPTSLLLVAHWD